MDQNGEHIKRPDKNSKVDPEEFEDQFNKDSYGRHEHGGHEHGHDWDDWEKEDREMDSKRKKKGFKHGRSSEASE